MPIALFRLLLFLSLCSFCFGEAKTPIGEVQALQSIAKALGKTDWDFTVDPCGRTKGWYDESQNDKDFWKYVNCNCSYMNNTVCHVTEIVQKSQSLAGTLPTDLSGLPYLTVFDVTRNYLNGTIPSQWGSSKLSNISLIGNRLTGPIPKEFGNLSTLLNFTADVNQLSGVLPSELGNLPNLTILTLTSNYFTGLLPPSFAKLTKLKDFRISDNNFTGPIPEIVTNWVNLEKLYVQGSGFSAPIPAGISKLVNLKELKISDLKQGKDSSFPSLSNMTQLQTLVLRNCSIADELPQDLANITPTLKTLDLSFNNLMGTVDNIYGSLKKTGVVYFTGNKLSGSIPDGLTAKTAFDLSYNNFTYVGDCNKDSKMNLFSASSVRNKTAAKSCVPSCNNKEYYDFHINCGGPVIEIDGQKYDADIENPRAASFSLSQASHWALSNTGNYLDNSGSDAVYTTSNETALHPNASKLYETARVSPLSTTYYGYCLKNGDYRVKLHFAEIRFLSNASYSSLGRSIFNVYIQGDLVLDEFNIVQEVGGGIPLVKTFPASVVNNTLEIRFYWAGKGTTIIPTKGVYGPIISAISVRSNVDPPANNKGIIIGGVIAGVVLLILLVLGILWWKGCICAEQIDEELKNLNQQANFFSLRQIKAATDNFNSANEIGRGGFGQVYKGVLSDGTVVAVKKLSSKSNQGNREFVNEIGMISALQHPHLVRLYGCCMEGAQLLLIYEYMENNSLARALYGPEENQIHLDWPTRQRICIGIARGLAFLHEESTLKIVHRDIKATNVLLDKDLNAKISDFGLAKLDDEESSFIQTRIAGTFGYMAPEYAMRGYLTDKADVYSFGIVALEIVSGKSNSSYRSKDDSSFFQLDVALSLKAERKLLELVDPRLGVEYNQDEVMNMINIALLCSNVSPADRPSMSTVVSMLEGRVAVYEVDQNSMSESMKLQKAIRKQHYDLISDEHGSESHTRSLAVDGPWTGSSTSAGDLYPVTWNTDDFSGQR